MSPPNGHANGSVGNTDQFHQPAPSAFVPGTNAVSQFGPAQIKEFVSLLEVPFDPGVIEWRVTNTSKGDARLRGQVIPYADQRAYTDRLNTLFSPAGWTRRYTVHTSANFQRTKDQKTTAKVFVTCDLTIFGIGSHSATGEEWTMTKTPALRRKPRHLSEAAPVLDLAVRTQGTERELVQRIEGMAELLGKGLYRGLLKTIATAWKPSDTTDVVVLEKVLAHMQAAERGLKRLEAALDRTGPEPLATILRSFNLNSFEG